MSQFQWIVLISGFVFCTSSYSAQSAIATDDVALVQAVTSQKRVDFLTAKGLVVSKLLKEDTSGSPHQKFVVKLSNGRSVTLISNLDMCEKVPVQVGDVVGAGGQFIPTGKFAGILHWTHKDPRHNRPDGYIQLGDHVFCQ